MIRKWLNEDKKSSPLSYFHNHNIHTYKHQFSFRPKISLLYIYIMNVIVRSTPNALPCLDSNTTFPQPPKYRVKQLYLSISIPRNSLSEQVSFGVEK